MSAALETVTCPVADCGWTFTGEPDAALYEQRKHELVHDVDDEVADYLREQDAKTADPEAERMKRTIASLPPTNGKSAAELDAEYRDTVLAQEITVRCADCLWEETGPQRQVRLAWGAHRRDEHGDAGALTAVERSLEQTGRRRRTSGGKLAFSSATTLERNIAKAKAGGGGHGHDRVKAKLGLCKRPGCQEASLGAKMGPYAGLCKTHTEEARAAKSKRQHAAGEPVEKILAIRRASSSAPSNPNPSRRSSPPPTSKPVERSSLVDAARRVEEALVAVHASEEAFEDSRQELREAIAVLEAEMAAAWAEAA